VCTENQKGALKIFIFHSYAREGLSSSWATMTGHVGTTAPDGSLTRVYYDTRTLNTAYVKATDLNRGSENKKLNARYNRQ
jgi:hypothetical protein